MYCEAERAKLTRMLSALKERQGDVASAADILQDVNVETWVFGVRVEILRPSPRGSPRRRRARGVASTRHGTPSRRWRIARATSRAMASHARRAIAARASSIAATTRRRARDAIAATDAIDARRYGALSKREKVDYILDQVRLMLAKGDRVRAYILSKKVQRKTLEEDDLQDLKVRFYKLMSEYHVLEDAPFDLAQNFWAIFNTKTVQDDEASWRDALSSTALFLALSQHAPGVSDMMHRVLADATASPKLEKLPTAKHLLTLFTTQEIVAYPLTEEHQRAVEAHPALHTAGPEIHQGGKTR